MIAFKVIKFSLSELKNFWYSLVDRYSACKNKKFYYCSHHFEMNLSLLKTKVIYLSHKFFAFEQGTCIPTFNENLYSHLALTALCANLKSSTNIFRPSSKLALVLDERTKYCLLLEELLTVNLQPVTAPILVNHFSEIRTGTNQPAN